jgi:hypothetical protein
MLSKRRSLSMILTGALMFLSLAVFGLGLHNKLSLYKANRHLHHRIVKLSVRQRSAQALLPAERQNASRTHISSPEFLRVSLSFHGDVCRFTHAILAEANPCSIGRYDLLGPNQLPLPPPTLS